MNLQDRVNHFVDELEKNLERNIPKIGKQFSEEYEWPEFDPLRDEICKLMIPQEFGQWI